MSREDADFGRYLPRLAYVRTAALTGVFALGVFADDNPVKGARLSIAERGGNAAEDFGRADVGVLLERLANGEAEAPKGDVVRNVCSWKLDHLD